MQILQYTFTHVSPDVDTAGRLCVGASWQKSSVQLAPRCGSRFSAALFWQATWPNVQRKKKKKMITALTAAQRFCSTFKNSTGRSSGGGAGESAECTFLRTINTYFCDCACVCVCVCKFACDCWVRASARSHVFLGGSIVARGWKKFNVAILVQILVYFWQCMAKTCHLGLLSHTQTHTHGNTLKQTHTHMLVHPCLLIKARPCRSLFLTGSQSRSGTGSRQITTLGSRSLDSGSAPPFFLCCASCHTTAKLIYCQRCKLFFLLLNMAFICVILRQGEPKTFRWETAK